MTLHALARKRRTGPCFSFAGKLSPGLRERLAAFGGRGMRVPGTMPAGISPCPSSGRAESSARFLPAIVSSSPSPANRTEAADRQFAGCFSCVCAKSR